jgi:hypothetical protein
VSDDNSLLVEGILAVQQAVVTILTELPQIIRKKAHLIPAIPRVMVKVKVKVKVKVCLFTP